ncbi:MAG TPA: hypothetical protein DEP35_07170 [Deltaproteobacteria bacterium]|nr:hypothetical protein [Deltaproteobacteria bacterium]
MLTPESRRDEARGFAAFTRKAATHRARVQGLTTPSAARDSRFQASFEAGSVFLWKETSQIEVVVAISASVDSRKRAVQVATGEFSQAFRSTHR